MSERLNFAGVLAEHDSTERFRQNVRSDELVTWGVRCSCGQELAWGDDGDRRTHLAAALNAEVDRWLADEGTWADVMTAALGASPGTPTLTCRAITDAALAALTTATEPTAEEQR